MNVTVKTVPEAVYERIKHQAAKQGRSLNSQIIEILKREAALTEQAEKRVQAVKELRQRMASMPVHDDSVELLREERSKR